MTSSYDQSYLDYWGFNRAPFALTPDPDMLYLSKQHRECMLRLQYAIAGNKGGALLVSENPGDGKTSVLRRLEQDLGVSEEEHYRIVFIDHPTLTANQMLWEILRQLGLGESKGEKIQNLLQLRGALVEMYQKGERCIFILDEGQLLADRPDLLQEFRVLMNYTVGDTFLLTFIFSGQSELEGIMKRLPEFYQRLPVRYFLHSMDLVDTGRMLDYRVKVAGYAGPQLFSETAVNEIYRYSRGIPRIICSAADLSLVVGHSRGARMINDREVFMAIRDLDRSTQDGYHYYHFLRSAGAATPEEEKEISDAEAELDKKEAEAALQRLEAAEQGGAGEETVSRLAAEIEAWSPEDGYETPVGMEERGDEGSQTTPSREVTFTIDEDSTVERDHSEEVQEAEEKGLLEIEEKKEGEGEEEETKAEESVSEIEAVTLPPEVEIPSLVHCPVCGARQQSDRGTCGQCGGPLHWICPSCKHKNPTYRPRCDQCGQSLSNAVAEAEFKLKESVFSSVSGPQWGVVSAPEFSLKLAEGEKILMVIKSKTRFKKGVKIYCRTQAWGSKEQKIDLVISNQRIHAVAKDLQSRIPYHDIQGVNADKGKILLFHKEGSLRLVYPASESALSSLLHDLIDYLDFQTGRFKV